MKNLSQFVNEAFTTEEIGRKNVNVSWEEFGKKIASKWKDIPSELKSILEDAILNDIKSFYDNTPKKRNATSMCMIDVVLNINSDSSYNKLKSFYEKVGMSIWMPKFPMCICSGEIVGSSTSREGAADRNKVNIKEHFYNSWRKPNNEMGNGYNNLPGDIITEYRDKFMNCISGAEVVVSKDKVRNMRANTTVPRYNVTYNAIYDKSKVNKLISEIENKLENEFASYSKSLSSTSKALDKYYSSKRSGEYTGD